MLQVRFVDAGAVPALADREVRRRGADRLRRRQRARQRSAWCRRSGDWPAAARCPTSPSPTKARGARTSTASCRCGWASRCRSACARAGRPHDRGRADRPGPRRFRPRRRAARRRRRPRGSRSRCSSPTARTSSSTRRSRPRCSATRCSPASGRSAARRSTRSTSATSRRWSRRSPRARCCANDSPARPSSCSHHRRHRPRRLFQPRSWRPFLRRARWQRRPSPRVGARLAGHTGRGADTGRRAAGRRQGGRCPGRYRRPRSTS